MMFVGPASCGDVTEAGLAEAIPNILENILNFRIHPLIIRTKCVQQGQWYMQDVSQFMHLQQMAQSWYNNPICHVSLQQFLLKQQ